MFSFLCEEVAPSVSFVSGLHLKFTINVWGGLADHTPLRQVRTPGLRSEVLGPMGKNRTLMEGEFRVEDLG